MASSNFLSRSSSLWTRNIEFRHTVWIVGGFLFLRLGRLLGWCWWLGLLLRRPLLKGLLWERDRLNKLRRWGRVSKLLNMLNMLDMLNMATCSKFIRCQYLSLRRSELSLQLDRSSLLYVLKKSYIILTSWRTMRDKLLRDLSWRNYLLRNSCKLLLRGYRGPLNALRYFLFQNLNLDWTLHSSALEDLLRWELIDWYTLLRATIYLSWLRPKTRWRTLLELIRDYLMLNHMVRGNCLVAYLLSCNWSLWETNRGTDVLTLYERTFHYLNLYI